MADGQVSSAVPACLGEPQTGSFVQGETKGLSLRSTRRRTSFRPDSKQLSGMRLEDLLKALEEQLVQPGADRAVERRAQRGVDPVQRRRAHRPSQRGLVADDRDEQGLHVPGRQGRERDAAQVGTR